MAERKERRRLLRNRSGQGLIEYVLIIAILSIALMFALVAFRNQVGNSVDGTVKTLQSAPITPYVPGGSTAGPGQGGGNGRGRGRGPT